jgi:hypothetical protein
MCVECGCGGVYVNAQGNQDAITITPGVRVAEGQSADVIKGFDVLPPYGKGNK